KLAAEHPRSFPVQLALGRALKKDGQTDEAMEAFERAATLVPLARGKGSPREELAAMALAKNDRGRAVAELPSLIGADFNNVEAARRLAGLLRQNPSTEPARLQHVYGRIASIDPFDGEAHAALGRLALQRNDASGAAREFQAVLALNPVDRAAAYTDL